jgi:hypothetical protein
MFIRLNRKDVCCSLSGVKKLRLKPFLKNLAFICPLLLLSCLWFFLAGTAAAQEADTDAFPDTAVSVEYGGPAESDDSTEDSAKIMGKLSYLSEELSFTVDIRQAYLVPQTVYVGDTGRLTLHLEAYSGMFPFIQEKTSVLPHSKALVVSRIEMRKYEDLREPRKNYFQLLIDFTAFEPGSQSLPAFDIPVEEPYSGVFYISGLSVNIASILSSSSMEISGLIPPLSVPGTSFLIYGTLAVMVLVCFSVIYFFSGRYGFRRIRARLERRRLIRSMGKTIRRIRDAGRKKAPEEGLGLAELALLFSSELRKTLSCLSALNCRALTAGEFLSMVIPVSNFYGFPYEEDAARDGTGAEERDSLSPDIPQQTAPDYEREDMLSPSFLGKLFRRCDILRFSGRSIDTAEFLAILDEAELFINALNIAEKKRNSRFKDMLRKGTVSVYPALKNERETALPVGGLV